MNKRISDGVRRRNPHSRKCFTRNGETEPFQLLSGEEYLTSRGGNPGSVAHTTLWYCFCCNDPNCGAELIVRRDALMSVVNALGGGLAIRIGAAR